MPWPAGYVPRYRLDRSSGQACVELSGVKHYLGPHGTSASKLLYDRLVTEWLANGRRSPKAEQPSISVIELAAQYLKFADGYYRRDGEPTGAVHSVKATLRYLVDWYGDDLAVDFGPLALKAFRRRLVDRNQSRRYVNDHVDRVKRMFKWAVGEQLVPPATYQALASVTGLRRGRTTARETEPVQPVDDEIVDATLPFGITTSRECTSGSGSTCMPMWRRTPAVTYHFLNEPIGLFVEDGRGRKWWAEPSQLSAAIEQAKKNRDLRAEGKYVDSDYTAHMPKP